MTSETKTALPGAQTIAAIIERAATLKGDGVLVKDGSCELTGAEFWRNIQAMASHLNANGLNKGDNAVFLSASSVAHAVALSACLVSGITACCLHTRETILRNKANRAFLNAKVLFADTELMGDAQEIAGGDGSCRLIDLSADVEAGADEFAAPNLSVEDPALILLSSGTTGHPKFILHSQGSLAATAEYGPYNYDCWSPFSSNEPSVYVELHPVPRTF